jgi:hypothetical protein
MYEVPDLNLLQISEFNLLSRNHCHLFAQIFISIFFFQMSLKLFLLLLIRVYDLACGSQLVLLLLYRDLPLMSVLYIFLDI